MKPSLIANEILGAMLAKSKAWEVRQATDEGYAECRDWGSWENPPEAEDDEDYDWQVLTEKSANMLDEISKKFIGMYPNHTIRICTEEKNWITIQVTEKE